MNQRRHSQCCFKNCASSSSSTKIRQFFRFPAKNRERALEWITLSGNDKLKDLRDNQLVNRVVCSDHFLPEQIFPSGKLFPCASPRAYDFCYENAVENVTCVVTADAVEGIAMNQHQCHVCCFKNCTNSNRTSNYRSFRFPVTDRERTIKWIEQSGNDSLLELSNEKLANLMVCSNHFQLDQILPSGRLFRSSIPKAYEHSPLDANNAIPDEDLQCPPERDNVPPFIIVHETVDVTVDLIDEDEVSEDVDDVEEVYGDDRNGISLVGDSCRSDDVLLPGLAEPLAENNSTSSTNTCNAEPDYEISEAVEEFDPLAIEDCPSDSETPLLGVQDHFEGVTNKSTLTRDHDQQTSEPTCVIKDLQQAPFLRRSPDEQIQVIATGRPTPTMEFSGSDQLNFGSAQYDKYTWITGSRVLKKLFCWPCLLFSRALIGVADWIRIGYAYHSNLDAAIAKHENLQNHIKSAVKLALYKFANAAKFANCLETETHNEKVKKTRAILQRMIDAVCVLAKMNVPFRICDASDSDSSLLHGTYLALVNSLSESDQMLKNHFETPNVNPLTDSKVRCGLIVAIGKILLNEIKQEIDGSKFVSVILCQTSGEIKGSQYVSTVLRYVDRKTVPHERFIGYDIFENINAGDALFDHIVQVVEEFNIQSKLVALSFSGQLTEFYTDIKSKYPNILIKNNHPGHLNSVLLKVCSSIKECNLYLASMSDMVKFFSKATVDSLFSFLKINFPELEFSRIHCTSWEILPQLLAFFKDIVENSENWNDDTLLRAQGYQCFFEDFLNTFLLAVFAMVFSHTKQLSNLLLESELDICECLREIERVKAILDTENKKFCRMWKKVVTKRRKCNLHPTEPLLLKRKVSTYSRKKPEQEDSRNEYEVLFMKIINSISFYLSDYFQYLKSLELNELLNFKKMGKYRSCFPADSFLALQKTYPGLFNFINLRTQLSAIYHFSEFKHIPLVKLMAHMKNTGVQNLMPEVYTLATLCLTLPDTNSSKDVSFLASERMKRVSEELGQHRKSKLALLSIENQFLSQLKDLPDFYTKVLDEFARQEGTIEYSYL